MPTAMINRIAIPLLLSIVLSSAVTVISAMAFLDSASKDFVTGTAATENSSYNQNNNSIALSGNEKLVASAHNIPTGGDYYAANPIAIGFGSGSRTVITNGNLAMSHGIWGAGELSGSSEFSASSTGSRNPLESTQSASTNMQIDESVTDGRVKIGVLSGDGSPGRDGFGADPMSRAWKSPAIEIDEEYVGTYHISKNFSLSSSHAASMAGSGWLSCCGEDLIISLSEVPSISADDIFNCESVR
jgi:hypothetical protein